MSQPRVLSVVLFDGFDLLDVFGPLEIFGAMPDHFDLVLLGPTEHPVRSVQGPAIAVNASYSTAEKCDIALVPGGMGTRALVNDTAFLAWLGAWGSDAALVTSVCTGSAVLASAGLLTGYQATSNKAAFAWVRSQGPSTEWIPQARWVEDRDRWTSSGVAAGIDMALALVASLVGEDAASTVADRIEFEWHRDPSWDPFAALHGLVD